MDAEGAITCTTDASGVDGVGGYAFAADAPGEVWLVSEWWPGSRRGDNDAAQRNAGRGATGGGEGGGVGGAAAD
eukprot:3453801-Pleurochrysis_carterae.AAC.1